ncbi:MAG: transketolase [Spirochaetaceae bacterium]|nr:transketolase [Spirochaetaceae bacterium]
MGTDTAALQHRAEMLRIHSINMTSASASGHPTTCMSAAEIMSVLFFDEMRYDPRDPDALANDEFVLSKGHAAPVLYAAWAEAGTIPVAELQELRNFDSRLEGHPIPGRAPGVRVATGSLGQGLAAAIGMALAINHDGGGQRVYALLGDGEMAEGSVWEAMNLAPHLGVNNLCAILDMNRLGQSDPTLFGWDGAGYAAKAAAFGWHVHECDGHDVAALQAALAAARAADRPSFIVARTVKGKGVSFLEDHEAMHGKAVPEDQHVAALAEVQARIAAAGTPKLAAANPDQAAAGDSAPAAPAAPAAAPAPPVPGPFTVTTSYEQGDKIATRKAYGAALAKLGAADPDMFVLDADVKNSTFTDAFFAAFPERSVECYIAEQNMIGIATGLQARGKRACAATFAAFLSRAYDQVRMAAHSHANLKLAGSHTGVSIGEDGASQMGLEDVSMLRAVLGSAVLCPADGVAAEKLTCLAANYDGVSYVRTARPDVAVIYGNDQEFALGGSKVLRSSLADRVTLVGAGVTLHEALAAADLLAGEGIAARVIDCYSIKPLDEATLRQAASDTEAIVTAEDHYPEGGLGEAVAAAVSGAGAAVHVQAVRRAPHSGKGAELLAEQGLDAAGIAAAARSALA